MTTTGAQLLDFSDLIGKTETKNGATYKINEDQSVSVSGTPTQYTSFYLKEISLKAGSYCFIDNQNSSEIFVQLIGKDNTGKNFTLTEDVDVSTYVVFNVGENNTKTFDSTIKAMLNTGSTALPWEPYTGGKPSPSTDYPQEIKSVVNPVVKISNGDGTESQTVALPYTLNAIPVSSGGNYTDENGQQWIADYVDVERGKLVRCVYEIEANGEDKSFVQTGSYCNYSVRKLPSAKIKEGEMTYSLSSFFSEPVMFNNEYGLLYVTKKSYAQVLNDSVKNKTGHIMYALATPTETDLAPEEITALKSLHTYAGVTNVSNDALAWMKVVYDT